MGKMFYGGVPTGPDVQMLSESITLAAGDVIDYGKIAAMLGIDAKDARFRTVTNVWRKRMLAERNLEIVAEAGTFRVLNSGERLSHTIGRFGRGARMIGRSARNAATIKATELAEQDRVRLDHYQRGVNVLLDDMAKLRKAFDPPKPAQTLLRPGQ